MQVVVKLKPEFAPARNVQRDVPLPQELSDMVSAAGYKLNPMHPGSQDATLKLYYAVDVPDELAGSNLATRLSDSDVVEGAYVKPPDALP